MSAGRLSASLWNIAQPMMPSLRFIATRFTSTAAGAGVMPAPEAEA